MIEKLGRPAEQIVAEVLEATIRNFPLSASWAWSEILTVTVPPSSSPLVAGSEIPFGGRLAHGASPLRWWICSAAYIRRSSYPAENAGPWD